MKVLRVFLFFCPLATPLYTLVPGLLLLSPDTGFPGRLYLLSSLVLRALLHLWVVLPLPSLVVPFSLDLVPRLSSMAPNFDDPPQTEVPTSPHPRFPTAPPRVRPTPKHSLVVTFRIEVPFLSHC